MTYPPGAAPPPMGHHNEAQNGAQVGQQVGTQYGDTTIHTENTYHINQGDPPEHRYRVAWNFLAGGTPREAERLFGELVRNGHATTQIAYYYVLAVISGRSFQDIDSELLTGVVNARKICRLLEHDHWQEALDVVWRLLRSVQSQANGTPGNELREVLDSFAVLPGERQDEIALHTDMILNGVAQERLDAQYAHRVVVERLGRGRVARAWKFFQPNPAEPREYRPAPSTPTSGDWAQTLLGGAAMVMGLLAVLTEPFTAGALLAVPFLAGGGYLLLCYGIARQAQALHTAARRREFMAPAHPVLPRSPGHWVSTKFVEDVHRLVDVHFTAARPHVAGNWPDHTAGIRAHLKRRLVDLYGNAQVKPESLGWLIRWHAKRAAAQWGVPPVSPSPAQTVAAQRDATLFGLGIAVAGVGLVVLLATGLGPSAVFVGLGGFFAARGIRRIRSLRGLDELLRADAAQLHLEEWQGYQEWQRELADRPSEAEMARWLAMDKIYLKNDAIRRANLPSSDLVTHVVMTEGAAGAQRARVLHGPPRYSVYVVQIFLLTRSGVREAQVELDFLTGEAKNESRHLFRYNALASASVIETGLRTTRGSGPATEEVERLRRRTFRLTLVNGQDITVVAENFRSPEDSYLEDDSELFLVAHQASGIDAALPILEAVAAEGSDWIVREQERRQRWSGDWYE